ncbi:MAG: putative Ig domain-containing protein, partial [Gammaproteobacteria bacterium]|nr:putative Ig domain-containing protein [Gammaproteobacteria bacterium]
MNRVSSKRLRQRFAVTLASGAALALSLGMPAIAADPVTLGSLSDQSVRMGQELFTPVDVTQLFSDADANDVLTYTVEGPATWLSYNNATGAIEGVPRRTSDTGSYQLVATDQAGGRAEIGFNVTINAGRIPFGLNPVAYWSFDDDTYLADEGLVLDVTGNGNNGTYDGSLSIQQSTPAGPDEGSYLDLLGVNKSVVVPYNAAMYGDNFTVSVKVFQNNAVTDWESPVTARQDTSRSGLMLYHNKDGSAWSGWGGTGNNSTNWTEVEGASTPKFQAWQTLTLTFSSESKTNDINTGTYRFYVDGTLEQTVVGPFRSLYAPANMYIGAADGGTWGFFDGYIDELMVFDRALNQTEVSALNGDYDSYKATTQSEHSQIGTWLQGSDFGLSDDVNVSVSDLPSWASAHKVIRLQNRWKPSEYIVASDSSTDVAYATSPTNSGLFDWAVVPSEVEGEVYLVNVLSGQLLAADGAVAKMVDWSERYNHSVSWVKSINSEGYSHFELSGTGLYLNVENQTGQIQLSDWPTTYFSLQWAEVEQASVYVFGSPDEDDNGALATVTLDDGTNTLTSDWNITVNEGNAAARLTIVGSAIEDELLTASVVDLDGFDTNAVSYQWSRDGVAIAGATASTYSLGDDDVNAVISVLATLVDDDGVSEQVSATTSAVANINDLPVLSGTPEALAMVDQPYSYTWTATDVDNTAAELSFAMSPVPSWGSFDTATGIFSGTPTVADIGRTNNIVISVSDGIDNVELAPFSLTVQTIASPESSTPLPEATLWLRADAGVTATGTDVSSWEDLTHSGIRFNDAGASALQLTENFINFNPALDNPDGSNRRLTNLTTAFDAQTFVIVAIPSGTQVNCAGIVGNVDINDADNIRLCQDPADNYTVKWNAPGVNYADFGYGGSAWQDGVSGSRWVVEDRPTLMTIQAATKQTYNRSEIAQDNLSRYFNGALAEIIAFDRVLSDEERNRVESYLAAKYGVSLDQTTAKNYTDSRGNVIFDATAAGDYNQSMVFLGRDDDHYLDQKVASSSAADAIVTLALQNDFTSANADSARTTEHANNLQFFALSHNGGSTSFGTDEIDGLAIAEKTGREWRVSKTDNFTQSVSLKFAGFDEFAYLVKAPNGDFTQNVSYLGVLDSNGEIDGLMLDDGDVIALAKSDLLLWYRADQGVLSGGVAAQNDDSINLWQSKFGGFDLGVPFGEPKYRAGNSTVALNFSPVVDMPLDAGEMIKSEQLFTSYSSLTIVVVAAVEEANGELIYSLQGAPNLVVETILPDQLRVRSFSGGNVASSTVGLPVQRAAIFTSRYIESGSTDSMRIRVDGGNEVNRSVSRAMAAGNRSLDLAAHFGTQLGTKSRFAEVMFFNRALSDAELQKLESALAVKYGIALDQTAAQNYLDSTENVVWDATAAGDYTHGITILGRDDDAEVDQRISRNSGLDSILTMALDSNFELANSDPARSTSHQNNLQFAAMAHNGGSVDVVTGESVHFDARVGRIWQAQLAGGFAQAVNLKFAGYNDGSWALAKSADADFTADFSLVAALDSDGVATDVTLEAGVHYALLQNYARNGVLSVSGELTQGAVLSASVSDQNGLSGAIAYQWQLNGVDLLGETGATINLSQQHVGGMLSLVATYTDALGHAEEVQWDATAVVANINDAPRVVFKALNNASVNLDGLGTADNPITDVEHAFLLETGRYVFDFGNGPFEASVNADEGGGWVLAVQYHHNGRNNPAINVLGVGQNWPIEMNSPLGTDFSGDITKFANAGVDAMAQMQGPVELRFYGRADRSDNRVVHFRVRDLQDYARTGLGSLLASRATAVKLTGSTYEDTAIRAAITGWTDQGDGALIYYPFYDDDPSSYSIYWGVRGNGYRWEAGSRGDTSRQHTIHKVWLRADQTDSASLEILQNEALDIGPTVYDPDGDAITFRIEGKPSWATFDTTTGRLTGTPGQNDVGVHSGIRIIAQDPTGEEVGTRTFSITVVDVNDAPTLSGTPATTADEDAAYRFAPTANDADNDTLQFSIVNAPSWAVFDSTTGELSGTPSNSDVGNYTGIEISVTDGTETTTLASFDIAVQNTNDAPTLNGTPLTSINEDQEYSFTVTGSDIDVGDTLSYSLGNAPSWMSIDANGIVSGTPSNSDVGTSTAVVVTVTDAANVTASISFDVEVINTQDAPTITGTPAESIEQGSEYRFTPTAADIDGDALTFSITNPPAWASFDTTTGALSGTPTNADVGTVSDIVISVSDAIDTVSLPAFDLEVVNVNDAPTIAGAPATAIAQDIAYRFTPDATDIDVGDTLVYSIANKPSWASFDPATGALTGTPTAGDIGQYQSITMSVTDGEYTATLPAFDIEVLFHYTADSALVDAGLGTRTRSTGNSVAIASLNYVKDKGTVIEMNVYISSSCDADQSFVKLAVDWRDNSVTVLQYLPFGSTEPTDMVRLAANSVQSTSGDHAVYKITAQNSQVQLAQVSSPCGGSVGMVDPSRFRIFSDSPVMTSTAVTSAEQDQAYQYQLTATDFESDTLSFSVITKPDWLTFDGATGVLSGTPSNADVGDHEISVAVSDGYTQADQVFTVTVANVNDAPTLSGTPITSIDQGQRYSFAAAGADSDVGDSLSYSLSNAPSWMSVDANGIVSGTPSNADVGTTTDIVLTVADVANATASLTFSVEVLNVNDAPTISGSPISVIDEDQSYRFTVVGSDIDAGDTLSYSLSNAPSWMSVDANGVVSGTPSNADVGTSTGVVVSVSDAANATASLTFDVEVLNTQDAPVISGTPATSVDEDSTFSFTPTAFDDDGDNLVFSVVNQPSWTSIDPNTGELSGTPGNSDVGTTTGIVISVTDGTDTAALAAFDLEVVNVNDAPTFSGSINDVSLIQTLSFSRVLPTTGFSDIDGDSLSFSVDASSFDWMTVSGTTISGTTPTTATSGSIILTATDPSGASVSKDIPINVIETPVTLSIPMVADAPVGKVLLELPSTDDNGDSISFAISSGNDDGQFAFSNGQLSLATSFVYPETAIQSWMSRTLALNATYADGSVVAWVISLPMYKNAAPEILVNFTNLNIGVGEPMAISLSRERAHVSAIQTKGRIGPSQWVTEYSLQWVTSNGMTVDGLNSSGSTLFTANTGDDQLVENTVDMSTLATPFGLRIKPETYSGWPSMRSAIRLTDREAVYNPTYIHRGFSSQYHPDRYLSELGFTGITADNSGSWSPSADNKAVPPFWTEYRLPQGMFFDADSTELTVSVSGLPAGLSYDDATQAIVGEATAAGTSTVTVSVEDESGNTASKSFTIVVEQRSALNLAASALATQSDTAYGADASRAIDGNTSSDPLLYSTTFAPAQAGGAWWQADLGELIYVDGIELTAAAGDAARANTLVAYLADFDMSATDRATLDANAAVTKLNIDASAGTATASAGVVARYVKVVQGNASEPLALAEVRILNQSVAEGTAASAITVNEDEIASYTVAADLFVDSESLTYTASNLGAWVFFDGTDTLTARPVEGQVGEQLVTLTATDSAGQTSSMQVSFTAVAVNDAPRIKTQLSDVIVDEDSPYSQVLSIADLFRDVDGDALTLSVDTKPSWLNFEATSATLSGTPSNADVGTHTVTLSATDSALSVSQSYSLEVLNTQDAPAISGTPATSVDEDSAYSFTPTASDDDGDALTFSITNKPSWASFNTMTGALTGMPVNADVGNTTGIVISVSDGADTVDLAAFDLQVVNTQDVPVISGTPATSVNEDAAYRFVPTASDDDAGTTLTFSIANKPSWASFDTSTGELTGTPVNADVGSTTGIVISVSDGTDTVALPAFDLEVVNTQDTPVISGTPATSVNEDSAYRFTPTASDDDGDTLTFSIVNQPSWANFDTSTGALSGTPDNADVGNTTGIVISVSDGTDTVDLAAFDLQVVNTQDAPVIEGTPANSVDEDSAYSFTPTASDDDGDALTFSITNKPNWAVFDDATGALTGTPANADVGITTGIVISVNDGTDTVALAAFDLEVVNTQDVPVITGTPANSVDEDSAYSFTPTASDDDGDNLAFSIVNKPSWAVFSPSSGALSGIPTNADVGTTAGIVISVSDGTDTVALAAFDLEVVNTQDSPVISGTPATSVDEDSAYSFTPTASDDDGDTLTFSIANKPTWANFDSSTGTLSGTPVDA